MFGCLLGFDLVLMFCCVCLPAGFVFYLLLWSSGCFLCFRCLLG